jgi:AcrR family transcriptional regulator
MLARVPAPSTRAARRGERGDQQRAGILRAAEELLCVRGVQGLSVSGVCAAAGVSDASFHEAFTDLTDCMLATFDMISDRLATELLAAYATQSSWVDGVRAGLLVVLDFLQASPHRARFLLGRSVPADAPMLARRERLLADLARAFDADRPQLPADALPAPFGADAVIAAAASIIDARLLEEPVPALRELTGSLMAVLVMPTLGEHAARLELSMPLPAPAKPPTDHSIQALSFIAAFPGASNRAVALALGGLGDRQISRLLSRLARHDLIANAAGERRGAANAWRLTDAGSLLLAEGGKDASTPARGARPAERR